MHHNTRVNTMWHTLDCFFFFPPFRHIAYCFHLLKGLPTYLPAYGIAIQSQFWCRTLSLVQLEVITCSNTPQLCKTVHSSLSHSHTIVRVDRGRTGWRTGWHTGWHSGHHLRVLFTIYQALSSIQNSQPFSSFSSIHHALDLNGGCKNRAII